VDIIFLLGKGIIKKKRGGGKPLELGEFILRGITIFFILYILARILSKKLISQMTLFDFIAGITLGSMTATTFLSPNLPFIRGALALTLFSLLVLVIDYWTLKSLFIRKIFNSEPTLLMDNGRILSKEMRKVRFTIDELIAELRKKGVFLFSEVQTAVLETDGSVSVLKKADCSPVTPKNMKIFSSPVSFPQIVILQGKVLDESLNMSGHSKAWLEDQIHNHGFPDYDNILVAQVNPDGTLYIERV
jgi:uncharacterized membrane protein YcaP (DUF421 family)